MDEAIEELVIDVRATSDGFASDLAQIKGTLDNSLLSGFDRAGATLERGLLRALRSGNLGFEDLRRTAFQAIDQITAHALQAGLNSVFSTGQGGSGGIGGILGSAIGSLFGLPGRATGGPVSPGRGYVVGEGGPEVFVPTSAGRIEPNQGNRSVGRDVRVAIQLNAPRGESAPTSLKRSSRQLASAVRRALAEA